MKIGALVRLAEDPAAGLPCPSFEGLRALAERLDERLVQPCAGVRDALDGSLAAAFRPLAGHGERDRR